MKRILSALVLIPIVLALVFLPQGWALVFTAATALVACLAGWEYLGLTQKMGATPPRIAVMVAIAILFAVNYWYPDHIAAVLGILSLALLVLCTLMSKVDRVLPDSAASVFCLMYTGMTMLALPALHAKGNGPSLITFLLCVVWAGDSTALYVGKAFGKHKLAPSISPGKTWEGSIGSVAGSVAAAGILLLLAAFLERWRLAYLVFPEVVWYWLVLAVVVNVAAQIGDLAESALKRSAGVKDSGDLIPGHGGVLDRIDALLLAAPVMWYAQLLHQPM